MNGALRKLNAIAHAATYRSDIVVAAFLILAIVMMVIPLPTLLVDVLIAVNIAFSLLVLVVAFYIGRPADFSSLPPIILLGTLFRLSLSITTTRLILLHGDAGDIVETFGRFVIGGEVLVGLVVFLIITAAQFVVITKGAERVAEVAARFTLDAMPGKQMSIDNDMRNGDIDATEARMRRARLERDSQLYGAMDGAMKFVKGDAVTGLIIVFVNLVGGLCVGMLSRGLSFGEASQTYSLLTVGDGLVAQIPALLISIAAGIVVTRVTTDTESDLGSEIFRQLGTSDKALSLAAAILFAGGLVPGFPTVVFFCLGGLFGVVAFLIGRRRRLEAARKAQTVSEPLPNMQNLESAEVQVFISSGPTRHRVVVHAGSFVVQSISGERFRSETDEVRNVLGADLGLEIPAVELRHDPALGPERFRIDLEGIPIFEGELVPESLLFEGNPMHLDLLQIPYSDGPALPGERRAVWIGAEHMPVLREAGIGFLEPIGVIEKTLSQVLRRYAAHFIGIQETRELLNRMEGEYGELVAEAARVVPLNRLADILRRLIEEDVPIANLRVILEALVEGGASDADAIVLCERVRTALARQICHRHAQLNRVIPAYLLTRNAEEAIRSAMRQTGVGMVLMLPDDVSRTLIAQLKLNLDERIEGSTPVLLVPADLRRLVRNLLLRNGVEIPVLSFQEIAPEYSVHSLASITVGPHAPQLNKLIAPLPTQAERTMTMDAEQT